MDLTGPQLAIEDAPVPILAEPVNEPEPEVHEPESEVHEPEAEVPVNEPEPVARVFVFFL